MTLGSTLSLASVENSPSLHVVLLFVAFGNRLVLTNCGVSRFVLSCLEEFESLLMIAIAVLSASGSTDLRNLGVS